VQAPQARPQVPGPHLRALELPQAQVLLALQVLRA